MRRTNLKLMTQARDGDQISKHEMGRRYLLGTDGVPMHVKTGLSYLLPEVGHPSQEAAAIIAESLPLQTIVKCDLLPLLQLSASWGIPAAKAKVAVWDLATSGTASRTRHLLEEAAVAGHQGAIRARKSVLQVKEKNQLLGNLLGAFHGPLDADGVEIALRAAELALERQNLPALLMAVHAAHLQASTPSPSRDSLTVRAVALAERLQQNIDPLAVEPVELALEHEVKEGNALASYLFGRALCRIDSVSIPARRLVAVPNLRRGASLLLRAADAGITGAWYLLHHLYSDRNLSLTNAGMARYFLEKSAESGNAQAQRKLGALTMRSATTAEDSELAVTWLRKAADQEDELARVLLKSLVLPVEGDEALAQHGIVAVRSTQPLLAARLRLARAFGLTKLEALCVDPITGARPWGLMVGRNLGIAQTRRGAPRVVPACSADAMDALNQAVIQFNGGLTNAVSVEGDVRNRSQVQRRAFERHGLSECMYFSAATAARVEALRSGPKWSRMFKQDLQRALV